MYHCFKQNGFALKIINIIDIARLISHLYDREMLIWLLKKTDTLSNFLEIEDLIKNISQDAIDEKNHKLVTKVMDYEKRRKSIIFSKNMIFTQILHLIDPEPYINYAGGDLSKNKYLELFKTKYKRNTLRNS